MTTDLRRELDAAEKLIAAIQELSLARDLRSVTAVVRRAARQLTGADGATFVLKDGAHCYYADEDAISPLWKGSRFPMSMCVSGWVMTHREPVIIPDIYQDPRIPIEAYRPTFVKSLAIVPIRPQSPIAAIGAYWAQHHEPTEREMKLLQALANSTSVAMENIELLAELERRVEARTNELATVNRNLEKKNQELETFVYSASHDLRAPLRTIQGFAELLADDEGNRLTPDSAMYLERIDVAVTRMNALIEDLLSLARVSAAEVHIDDVDLSALADEILRELVAATPMRRVRVHVAPGGKAQCDPGLMRIVLQNLLGNAWKFTVRTPEPEIEFGFDDEDATRTFFVRDNGAGFPAEQAALLFIPFRRLHAHSEYPGSGVGLAIVRRIIEKHHGSVSAEGAVSAGATFKFSLPRNA